MLPRPESLAEANPGANARCCRGLNDEPLRKTIATAARESAPSQETKAASSVRNVTRAAASTRFGAESHNSVESTGASRSRRVRAPARKLPLSSQGLCWRGVLRPARLSRLVELVVEANTTHLIEAEVRGGGNDLIVVLRLQVPLEPSNLMMHLRAVRGRDGHSP